MARIAARDQPAFESLVQNHGPRLSRLIGRLTAWHADHEDLLQETLIAVWEKAEHYDERGTLSAWLTRIAVNRVKNRFRGLGRWRSCLAGLAQLFRHERADSVPAVGEDGDTLLAAALQRLPHADRNVLVLYYLEELPAEQIADIEGIRLETLHVRLHHARQQLKSLLEEQQPEDETHKSQRNANDDRR